VNSLTTPIVGTPIVCIGTNTTLSNATSGGSWSSSDPTKATVGATSGIVTGVPRAQAWWIIVCRAVVVRKSSSPSTRHLVP
jgi:hypothetical protein